MRAGGHPAGHGAWRLSARRRRIPGAPRIALTPGKALADVYRTRDQNLRSGTVPLSLDVRRSWQAGWHGVVQLDLELKQF